MIMSLADRLVSTIDVLDSSDIRWVQFIKDHYTYLLQRSTTLTVDATSMRRYQYMPRALLESLGLAPNIAWIIYWLNGIDNIRDVVNLPYLLIVDLGELELLHEQFNSLIKT